MEDPQKLIKEMKLSRIFIDDNKQISFELIYSKLIPFLLKNSSQSKELNIQYNNNKYNISLKKKNYIYFEISLYKDKQNIKTIEKAFINPIKIVYKFEQIEIAYLKQFNETLKLFQLKSLLVYCYGHRQFINYTIKSLIQHQLNSKDGVNCRIEIFENNTNNDDDYNPQKFFNFFNNINKTINEFESPFDFEINYKDYFDYYKYQIQDKKFIFLDDKSTSRELSVDILTCHNHYLGNFYIYYGQEGMGKSITLIKAFKYGYNHDEFGTLYIHCKCLNEYYNENYPRLKEILKNEIIYLFKNEYNKYKECLDFIVNFEKSNNNFIDLIISIINKFCINESKKYIFIFDQYKADFDPKGDLKKLNKSVIRNNKKYGLIACCSMDNKSVRELKIKNLSVNLFNEKSLDEDADNIIIKEVEELFDLSNLTIDNGGLYDKTWTKIGKTLRNYIVLKDFHGNNDYHGMIQTYVKNLKIGITDNLKSFFNLDKKIKKDNDNLNLINLYNILSFTVDTDYKIDYLKRIKNLIPFKYFDIKKNNDNPKTAKIIFNCELVGEVMNKIYEDIICENKNIYQIFDNMNLDKGALGGLYEKFIIHFMEPDEYTKRRRLFNYFNIIKIITVDKFVPKSNENYFNHSFEIIELAEGDYLFKQKQFGGKAVDCAVIRIKKNNHAEVFLFKISIHKTVLYSIEQLKTIIKVFIDYFSYQFKFIINEEDVYFTYIFHTKAQDELYKKYNKNGLKCIFFNPSIQHFMINDCDLDDENSIIDINNIFVKPFKLYNSDDDIIIEQLNNNEISNNILKPNYILNYKEKENIEKFLKDLFRIEFKGSNVEISFSHNTRYLNEEILNKQIIYLRQLKSIEINDWINQLFKDKESKKKYKKKSFILLIYRETYLGCRLITKEGESFGVKYIPLGIKIGIKNYDVYTIKASENNY